MNRIQIPIDKLNISPLRGWWNWMLLTAGVNEPGRFNPMTVSWGTIGNMWEKPIAQVVVRPGRYTYEFMEKYDTFTLCAFPAEYKDALTLLGTRSGREIDKVAESGLTPIPSIKAAAPGYNEAELIIECRKIYYHDFNPSNFLSNEIDVMYPQKDYHRSYFGEIMAVSGIEKFISRQQENDSAN